MHTPLTIKNKQKNRVQLLADLAAGCLPNQQRLREAGAVEVLMEALRYMEETTMDAGACGSVGI
jgi:predicted metal-dependent hydrolase